MENSLERATQQGKRLGRPRKSMVKSLIDVAIRKERVIKKKHGY